MRNLILVVLLILIASDSVAAQTTDPQLVRLRHQLAMGYAEPGPHMALAKYFWQKGDRLQAFLLLEYARRTRFREAQFNAAFEKEFGLRGPIESKPGEVAFNKDNREIALALQRVTKRSLS